MTHQEIFNRVYVHLLTQKKRAKDELGHCAYRGKDGTMCAVGCLIPDEAYTPEIETSSANALVISRVEAEKSAPALAFRRVMKKLGFKTSDGSFLRHLQTVHDCFEPEDWPGELANVAKRYKLTIPEMVNV